MAYPESIDNFTEKLNKNQGDNPYVIEEEVAIENGIYDGVLAHDNINNETIKVYTGEKLTGNEIKNFIISIPETMPWCRKIKIFTNEAKVYVTYETIGDQVEADDINTLQSSIKATQEEVDRYKQVNDGVANGIDARLTTTENNKAEKTYVDAELLKKADQSETYTKSETDTRINEVVGAAPQALDTLKEIAESLNNDDDFAGTMTTQLAGKVDKVAGKQLSTEDYSTGEKSKLAGIEAGANKYVHPSTHPASVIVQDTDNRFVTDSDKGNWNDANTKKHTHTNKTVLDGVTQALVDGWNSAVTHISDAVKHITSSERTLWNTVSDKVDKVTGKQLSTEDYSTVEKNKLEGLEVGANKYVHPSTHPPSIIVQDTDNRFVTDSDKANWNDANTQKHTHSNKSVVDGVTQVLIDGWNSAVTHISDVIKHITSSERMLWNTVSDKVDKVTGKQLSTEDYSTADKNKLADIEANANNYSHPSTHSMDMMTESSTKKIMTNTERVKLANIEAGAEVNNISDINASDLTDGGNSALHHHSSDRNRSNHTGVQLASTISDFTTTVRGTVLSGLSIANNAIITAADTILSALGKLQKQISDNLAVLTNHTSHTSNPHSVTKSQVGLGNVDNTSDLSKPISTAAQTALNNKSDVGHGHNYLPISGGTLTGHLQFNSPISKIEQSGSSNNVLSMQSLGNVEVVIDNNNNDTNRRFDIKANAQTDSPIFSVDEIGNVTLEGTVDSVNIADFKANYDAHNHDTEYEPKNSNIQMHIASVHAPSNAQKNSDITKAEIEAKLTGTIASHIHSPDHAHSNKAVLDKINMSGSEASFDLSDLVTTDELGAAGYGNMLKSVYDSNNNGKVDNAESADNVSWAGVNNKPSTYPPSSHNHNYLPLTGGTITGNLTIQDSVALTIGEGLKFLSQSDYFPGSTYYDARIIRMIDANGTSGNVDGGLVIEGYTNTDGLRKEVMTIRTNGEFTFLGNNVYHAGNFNPSSKLDKGPLTWNDLKGV